MQHLERTLLHVRGTARQQVEQQRQRVEGEPQRLPHPPATSASAASAAPASAADHANATRFIPTDSGGGSGSGLGEHGTRFAGSSVGTGGSSVSYWLPSTVHSHHATAAATRYAPTSTSASTSGDPAAATATAATTATGRAPHVTRRGRGSVRWEQ